MSDPIAVPYGMTVHGQDEIDAVVHVLKTSTQMGKHVREMEDRVSDLYAKNHGIMVNSGSSALYLAAEVLDFEAGGEVITPALTFATTVAPQVRRGLIPAFVDVEPGTYCIDADKVEEMITDKTKALVIPNLIGNLPDWQKLRELADKYNLFVLEDSADTLGALIGDKSSGRFSDMSITSFYGSHVINAGGNGGMLCVNSDEHYERAKLLRSWGRSSSLFVESEKIENRFNVVVDGVEYDSKFVFDELGFNLEPSEMGAAFGLVQLNKLNDNIQARIDNYNELRDFFSEWEDWFFLPNQLPNSYTGWLAFALTIKDSAPFKRREMQIFLEKLRIMTRTVFTGNIIRQPAMKNVAHRASKNGYPETDLVMRGGMLIACHHGLTRPMLDHLKNSSKDFLTQF